MTPLRIHYLEHVPFEGLGCIADWAAENGHTVTVTTFHDLVVLPDLDTIDWLIVMGGPMGVYETARYPWMAVELVYIEEAIRRQKKVLGICLGAQLIACALGARVYPHTQKEIGWFPVQFTTEGAAASLAKVFPAELPVFHWHGDTFDLPAQATSFAATGVCANQGYIYGGHVIGLQFHLEVRKADVLGMVHHGDDELAPAPYVQSAETIAAQSDLATEANKAMYRLLTAMYDNSSAIS
ncbi:amidotransferase [Chitinophaga agrisoli]|uniref:Amidotransferase n=1 Tax=Chitinophaga agrisoli TaxID=2607653 RepID=A0A5B2VKM3_9BACT|nr:gamma-glutamyl-gamma-aminobutyrate hydrolase family protein [Chitinophaga agrisoli]KAA2240163.1 amidotransferase [Chitinophaga agrisoli]